MKTTAQDPLADLALADPELARTVAARLAAGGGSPDLKALRLLTDETLWALSEALSMGKAVAMGYADLIGRVGMDQLEIFRRHIREAARKGPTLASLMAIHLPPVLRAKSPALLDHFFQVRDIMLQKGEHTLPDPLAALSVFLEDGDTTAAHAYLDLLRDLFDRDMTYNQARRLTHVTPKALRRLPPTRRAFQMREIARVIRADVHLTEDFLDSFAKGLELLNQSSLEKFVSQGLDRWRRRSDLGAGFLSLTSLLGREACEALQTAVSLSQLQHRLNRYLRARTGKPLASRSLSDLPGVPKMQPDDPPTVRWDGRFIYLPSEIDRYPTKQDNIALYKLLTRLEVAYAEGGTFDFDLMKMGDVTTAEVAPSTTSSQTDMEIFWNRFSSPPLARDLFTIYEHGRIRLRLDATYPAMMAAARPLLKDEMERIRTSLRGAHPLLSLYRTLALGTAAPETPPADITTRFVQGLSNRSSVEDSARLVLQTYDRVIDRLLAGETGDYLPLPIPFDRQLRPDLHRAAFQAHDRLARNLQALVNRYGGRLYPSDVKKHLRDQNGRLTRDDIRALLLSAAPSQNGTDVEAVLAQITSEDLTRLLGKAPSVQSAMDDPTGPVWRYPEWDGTLNDYRSDHVLVRERPVSDVDECFYKQVLDRRTGLVRKIRYSFELLKPQGLKMLRRWRDGDDFDYRAMLNFAIDRKAGLIPSDRIYTKRLKQERDVAVLLLVDLSRSTANPVAGAENMRVLDLEKEAIVLLCEALTVLGDSFAIAGFSGTGPLGVDYYVIKSFEETAGPAVRGRIGNMAPQRGTRMGAAIRHATAELEKMPAKVRLLLLLGDGFPNDLDYKRDYAVADTRQALLEARSKRIHAHGITVNMATDPQLDRLYGKARHNVISDVRELPDKLLRIYGVLTK